GWAILLRQKQKKLIMLPSETMIWQPEFTDKTLSRKPGAVHKARIAPDIQNQPLQIRGIEICLLRHNITLYSDISGAWSGSEVTAIRAHRASINVAPGLTMQKSS
ncbi:TPA: hypothetical protein ACWR3V_004970, partial [Escherichia coli]